MNLLFMASLGEGFSYLIYIVIAILVLLAMITVHEFGHYVSGKIFGFGIEEFSIGFGPKLFSVKKKNGEIFSLRAIPLGGYCGFKGEDKDEEDATSFNNKKPWQRIIVLISGALMNYMFAIIIISVMFGAYGRSSIMAYETSTEPPVYGEEYELQDRDVIIKINGRNIYILTDLMSAVEGKNQGDEINLQVLRKGEIKEITVKLLNDTNFKNVEDFERLCKALNIKYEKGTEGEIVSNGFRTTGIKLGFFKTLGMSFEYSFKLAGTIFTVIKQLFTGSLGINSLGGTVTTISVTANAIKTGGFWQLLNISGFMGVNLALFNLLPIPALDGSKTLFTIIEWIRKKPINRKVEGIIHTVGFVFLILFAILIDLQQCF